MKSSAEPAQPAGGKVTHDARGTAIWDWAVDTDVLNQKSTAELVQTLADPAELTIAAEKTQDSGEWRGDPYNRSRKR